MKNYKVITPLFPTYAQVKAMMKAVSGYSLKSVRSMITAILEQTGTPQNPVDWSEPDLWINERLSGVDAEIALRIWQTDDHILNPRHSYGCYLFLNYTLFDLMASTVDDIWAPTARGERFLQDDAETLRWLDDQEGLIQLLELLAGREMSRRADLLPEWQAFLHQHSKFASDRSAKSTLYSRLYNLIDRQLAAREGMSYRITDAGREWLTQALPTQQADPRKELLEAVKRYNAQQKELLREQLSTMNPYKFEHLVAQLLEAMGYEQVEVTKASGDKGVDVVGKVQVGITTITEVVQVKRMQNTINRPLIDQLRGALPYHKAIRGTLITTGRFAAKCAEAALYPGAAPITLIDGDRLLELLIENNVGIRRSNAVELLDVDLQLFDELEID
ncbi:restriction endonuclease [Salmonella enterica]|nr:restriction endonuclease [Salmonella enterica subsp. enterica serovar Lome]EBF9536075.1 restriction endonuclease [Salmonella enterica subsp. enterica serovar Ank]ECD3927185.1 restriction endonuclease [Salmonella enterica subsp. enterica serovar Wangata]ECK4582183.1 restriction endonuclease [Salmonella enterica]EBY1404709.1 restriction endonuclease [Salmonella enterica subsp. enterica serovar Lome]